MQSLRSPSDAAMWLRQHVTGVLCTDSRAVKEGDAFIACQVRPLMAVLMWLRLWRKVPAFVWWKKTAVKP